MDEYKRDGKHRFISIGIQIGLSCGNELKDFAENTATAICTAEIFESMGYSVEIVCICSWYPKTKKYSEAGLFFPIKKAEDPTDIRAVASTSLSGFMREYCFKIFKKRFNYVSGTCMRTSKELLSLANMDIIVAKQWEDAEGQVNFIDRVIKEKTA